MFRRGGSEEIAAKKYPNVQIFRSETKLGNKRNQSDQVKRRETKFDTYFILHLNEPITFTAFRSYLYCLII